MVREGDGELEDAATPAVSVGRDERRDDLFLQLSSCPATVLSLIEHLLEGNAE